MSSLHFQQSAVVELVQKEDHTPAKFRLSHWSNQMSSSTEDQQSQCWNCILECGNLWLSMHKLHAYFLTIYKPQNHCCIVYLASNTECMQATSVLCFKICEGSRNYYFGSVASSLCHLPPFFFMLSSITISQFIIICHHFCNRSL